MHISSLLPFLICLFTISCSGQDTRNTQNLPLQKEITLNGVHGRIDHMDVNLKDQVVYMSALGNNTLEVADLRKGTVIHSIKGLSEPQGVAYIPKHNEIFVANGGTGECIFYDAADFKKIASVKFDDDADDARYDETSDRVFVGYGSGGIGIIDAATHKLAGDIKLPAHPESFQLDTKQDRIWINLPGAGMIGIASIKEAQLIDKWKRVLPRSNFPMAYDGSQHRVIVAYRIPATLKVLDSKTGKEIFSSSMVGDSDDLYWDEKTKQIFISGGGGAIDVFKQNGTNSYQLQTVIKTTSGARTSLLVPELRLFILACRESGGTPAKLQLYTIK